MNWPTSQDYNEAVQDPATSFADPGLRGGEVAVNAMGLPIPRSGNFADVYQFTGADGKVWALKCFTRKVAGLKERYARIDAHLTKARLPFAVGFKFLPQGVMVRGEWYPLLKMEWVEGFTLNDFVSNNLDKPHHLHALMQMWAKLAARLRDADMAHADLQHGNVLLVPGATPQKLGLKLIDYDGMWVPALAESHPGEVGHPNFQHPLRLRERLYNADVDRFPHLVIAAGLRAALVGGRALWDRFDNGDNLLFKEADLRAPAAAPVFKALWELNDPVLRTLVGHIALASGEPLRKTPWLDDVLFAAGGPRLTADQERQVCDLLGVTAAAPVGTATAPAGFEREFNVFEFLDEDEAPKAAGPAASGRQPPLKRKQKSKAPLWISGGVAAAVLVAGVVIALALKDGKTGATPVVTVNKDKEKDAGPKPGLPVTPKKEPTEIVPVRAENDAIDRALQFSGRGYVELQKTRGVVDLNGSFTVEIWARWPTGRPQSLTIMGDEAWPGMETPLSVPRACGWVLRTSGAPGNESRTFDFTAGADLGEWLSVVSPAVDAPGGKWHHLAVSKSGANVRVFLDGQLIAERKSEGVGLIAAPTNLYVGVRKDGYGNRTFEGEVKGFRVSNRGRYSAPFKPEEKLVKDASTEVLLDFPRGTDDSIPDLSGKGRHGLLQDVKWVEVPKTPDAIAPPAGGPSSPAIGVAALPGGRDFLFLRQKDPAVYRTVNGSVRKAEVIGRHATGVRTLAAAPDGSRAVTGDEAGEVRLWWLQPPGPAGMKQKIASYPRLAILDAKWGFDAYEEGIVVRQVATGKEEAVPAGPPGQPVREGFKTNLDNNARLRDLLGRAQSGEVKLFGGDLVVQVFEGGAQFFDPALVQTGHADHVKRKAVAGGPPAADSPRRADRLWIDEALPAGVKVDVGGTNLPWTFVGKKDGPVHTGEKAIKLTADGLRQNMFEGASPGLRVVPGDVLFAFVYLDPTNPPEEVMLQWHSTEGSGRAYWGANKIEWGRDNSSERRPMGTLPGAGRWARLAMPLDAVGIKPGATIDNLAIAQFGGTAHWDTIGVSSVVPPGPADAAPPAAGPAFPNAHGGAVVASAISANSGRAVTAGADGTLCEWDLGSAKLLRQFKVPGSRAVAILKDGRTVLVGTEANSAELWNLDRAERVKVLPGHVGTVDAVCVSPLGNRMWTAGADGIVRVWTAPDGNPVKVLPTAAAAVEALAVSSDGRYLACGGPTAELRVFDGKTGQLTDRKDVKVGPQALAFLPGGGDLLVAQDPDPVLVNLHGPADASGLTLQQVADLTGSAPDHMGYRPDGKYLWVHRQNEVVVLDGRTGQTIKAWPVETFLHADFGPAEKLCVIAGFRLQLWDLESGVILKEHPPGELRQFLACLPTHLPTHKLVTSPNKEVVVWDVAQWKEVERFTPFADGRIVAAAPFADNRRYAFTVAPPNNKFRYAVYDVPARREVFGLEQPAEMQPVLRFEVSPDGRWILGFTFGAAATGQIVVWDGRTGKHERTVALATAGRATGGFSPAGDHYFFCAHPNRRQDLHVPSGKLTEAGSGVKAGFAADVAATAGLFASFDTDNKVRVYRFEKSPTPGATGGDVKESPELSDDVVACTWSSDGKKVFAATRKGVIHVLDAATAAESNQFEVSKAGLVHVALSPKYTGNPDRLYALDNDRHLFVYDGDKGTKPRETDLARLGKLPPVSPVARLVIAPGETHVLLFDPAQNARYAWAPPKWETAAVPAALQKPTFGPNTQTVAYAADGTVGAAVAGRDLLVWRQKPFKEIRTIKTPGLGRWIGLAPEAGAVVVIGLTQFQAWKYDTGADLGTQESPHDGRPFVAAVGGSVLVTAGEDRCLRLWDLRNGADAGKWQLDQLPAGVAVSPNGRTAAVWSQTGKTVGLWALPDLKGKKP